MATQPIDPSGAQVTRIGAYRLHGVLGEGGMGVVHLGVDSSGRAVAVKVLRDHVAHDPGARSRLAREVATLRRVDHPAVAPFLGADVDGPRPYVVTRYVPGDPLDAWVREHGPLSGDALRSFGATLADALEAIHAAGVVHRDLKPGNVLMPNASPVVIDFGIAHVADESRLTSTGLVMGTPGYIAPELLDGHDVSVATDLWGYAATVAFAATGRSPFGTGHTSAVLDRVRRGAADLRPLAPWFVDVLRAALDVDPARRPSLAELRAAIGTPGRDLVASSAWSSTETGDEGRADIPPTEAVSGAHSRPEPDETAPPRTEAMPTPGEARTEAMPRAETGEGRTQGFAARHGHALRGAAAAAGARAWSARAGGAGGVPTASTDPATMVNPVVSTRVMPVVPPRERPSEAQTSPPPEQRYAAFEDRPHPVVSTYGHPGSGRPPDPRYPGPGGAHPAQLAHPAQQELAARAPISRRMGTLFGVGFVLVTLTGYLPALGLLVALGWSWLARFVDRVVTSVALRRMHRGPRDRDVPLAVLASPWHLLGSAFSAVVAGILPLLVGVAFSVGLRSLSNGVAGVPLGLASSIMVGASAALIVAWWGPGGGTLRRGSRSVVRGLAPGRIGAVAGVVVLVVAGGVLGLMTQSSGWALSWWPLEGVIETVSSLFTAW